MTVLMLKPDESLPPGYSEARRCNRCTVRLAVVSEQLGKMIQCPNCGCENRAITSDVVPSPSVRKKPVEPVIATRSSTDVVLPMMGSKPNLFVGESTYVTFIGWLNLGYGLLMIGSAVLFLVLSILFEKLNFLIGPTLSDAESNATVWKELLVCGLLILIGLCACAVSPDVLSRRPRGWLRAVVMAVGVLLLMAGVLVLRNQNWQVANGAAVPFLMIPSLIYGLSSLVILLVPGHLNEFNRPDTTATIVNPPPPARPPG